MRGMYTRVSNAENRVSLEMPSSRFFVVQSVEFSL